MHSVLEGRIHCSELIKASRIATEVRICPCTLLHFVSIESGGKNKSPKSVENAGKYKN